MKSREYKNISKDRLSGLQLVTLRKIRSLGGITVEKGEVVRALAKTDGFHIAAADGRSIRQVNFEYVDIIHQTRP